MDLIDGSTGPNVVALNVAPISNFSFHICTLPAVHAEIRP